MTWREDYQQASFRGVPFHVGKHDSQFGRRVVSHEFPGRSLPFVEDLGRSARGFTVEGWVIGPDYYDQRDALIEACEAGGPGILVHPYLGSLVVSVPAGGLLVRESSDEGGMARLAITFVETVNRALAASIADAEAEAAAAAAAAEAAAQAEFAAQLADQAPSALATAAAELNRLGSEVLSRVRAGAAFAQRIADYVDGLADFLADPFPLAQEVVGILQDTQQAFAAPLAAIEFYSQDLFDDFEPRTIGGGGLLSTTINLNARAVSSLVRAASLSSAVRAASTFKYESYDQALEVREGLLERIDTLIEQAPDPLIAQLGFLRSKLTAAVPPEGEDLPRLRRLTLPQTTPGIVLAWDLYADAERESDIVARNGIRHPGFVRGGRELEVLSG